MEKHLWSKSQQSQWVCVKTVHTCSCNKEFLQLYVMMYPPLYSSGQVDNIMMYVYKLNKSA